MKVQVVPAGRPPHCSVTAPAAPFCEFTVILKFADCPTDIVAEVGETLPVKLGASCTTSVAFALAVSEPLVAVTVNG